MNIRKDTHDTRALGGRHISFPPKVPALLAVLYRDGHEQRTFFPLPFLLLALFGVRFPLVLTEGIGRSPAPAGDLFRTLRGLLFIEVAARRRIEC